MLKLSIDPEKIHLSLNHLKNTYTKLKKIENASKELYEVRSISILLREKKLPQTKVTIILEWARNQYDSFDKEILMTLSDCRDNIDLKDNFPFQYIAITAAHKIPLEKKFTPEKLSSWNGQLRLIVIHLILIKKF